MAPGLHLQLLLHADWDGVLRLEGAHRLHYSTSNSPRCESFVESCPFLYGSWRQCGCWSCLSVELKKQILVQGIGEQPLACNEGMLIAVAKWSRCNMVATRTATNANFYGDAYLRSSDLLLVSIPWPRAAGPLYSALHD